MKTAARGFTLIELLVVISIISILSMVGFVSYQNVRNSALSAKRKADIDAIKKAYETNFDPTLNSGQGGYKPLTGANFTSGKIPTPDGTTNTSYIVTGPDSSAVQDNSNTDSAGNVSGANFLICAPDIGCKGSSGGTSISTGTNDSSKYVVWDTFNRDDKATTLDQASSGQSWVFGGGKTNTFGIHNNQATQGSTTYCNAIAVINSGLSNGILNATLKYVDTRFAGVVFRHADFNNAYMFYVFNGEGKLYRKVRGLFRQIGSIVGNADLNAGLDIKIKVVFNSAQIQVYINDSETPALDYTDTDTSLSSNTNVGLWGGCNLTVWDNFSVQSL